MAQFEIAIYGANRAYNSKLNNDQVGIVCYLFKQMLNLFAFYADS